MPKKLHKNRDFGLDSLQLGVLELLSSCVSCGEESSFVRLSGVSCAFVETVQFLVELD